MSAPKPHYEPLPYLPPATPILIGPPEGWEDDTWYLVDVSPSRNCPISRCIFFSGTLDHRDTPVVVSFLSGKKKAGT